MATKIWRGTAKATAQVDHVTPALLNPGDTVTLTCNGKSIAVQAKTDSTSQSELVADVVGKLVSAVGQYSNSEPEFAEVSASAGTDAAGRTTHLILTGPTDGKPVTITSSATQAAFSVIVQQVRRGRAATKSKQLLVPRGTYSGGTFALNYDGATISSIAYNASAATLQTAINSGKDATSPSVTVSGDAGGPYLIETTGSALPEIIVDGASLTGGDFVEVIQGTDGRPAGLSLLIARDTDSTDAVQWRLTLGTDPGSTVTTTWIDSTSTSNDVAYALLAAGYFASVRPGTGDSQWDIELISDLGGAAADEIQASIESDDDSYTVTETTRTATNEVQYVRINATSGNVTLGATNVAVDGADFFASSGTAGSLAKAILDETGYANTVEKLGSAAGNTKSLIKVTFTGGTEVGPLQLTDGSLAGGHFDNVILSLGVDGLDEIQRVSFNRAPTGGTFTLTYSGQTSGNIAYNAGPGAMVTALEALSNIGSGEAKVTGPIGGPWDVRFDGTLGDQELTLMTGSAANLTGGTTPTFTLANQTSSSSPHHWDVAANWYNPASPSSPSKPAASDTVVFRNNSVDCLYKLEDLAGNTLASVIVEASYTGRLGLPEYTGTYWEYRPKRLKCGITTLEIGRGAGTGSTRLNFDLQAVASTVTVFATAASQDTAPAVQIAGTSTSNVYRILSGQVGIGTGDYSDVPAGTTLTIGSGGNAAAGTAASVIVTGGTITTIEQIGGRSQLRCTATTFNMRAGNCTIDGAPTYTTLNCAGSILCRSTGTITTLNVSSGGSFDLSSNAAGLTITNARVFGGGTLRDPWRKGTYTNGIDLVQCGVTDVTVDVGRNIVVETTVSTVDNPGGPL